jgi:hypothetical protein
MVGLLICLESRSVSSGMDQFLFDKNGKPNVTNIVAATAVSLFFYHNYTPLMVNVFELTHLNYFNHVDTFCTEYRLKQEKLIQLGTKQKI